MGILILNQIGIIIAGKGRIVKKNREAGFNFYKKLIY